MTSAPAARFGFRIGVAERVRINYIMSVYVYYAKRSPRALIFKDMLFNLCTPVRRIQFIILRRFSIRYIILCKYILRENSFTNFPRRRTYRIYNAYTFWFCRSPQNVKRINVLICNMFRCDKYFSRRPAPRRLSAEEMKTRDTAYRSKVLGENRRWSWK